MAQLAYPYMTPGKTIALTRRNFVGKVMSLLFNMLSRFVIDFLPRSKCVLMSWLHSPFKKDKIMASIRINSWQIDGEKLETVIDFVLFSSKSLQMVTAAMKLKDTYSLEGKL